CKTMEIDRSMPLLPKGIIHGVCIVSVYCGKEGAKPRSFVYILTFTCAGRFHIYLTGGASTLTRVSVRLLPGMWSFSVSELAIPGAEIGRISATDADLGENAKLEYTILEGETGETFNITAMSQEAVITLNKPVDYESRSSYSFSVEVLNPIVDPRFLRRGPFKDRASIRVAVLDADEPPRFSRSKYHMDVSENCPPACTVGRVSAVDPDTGLTNNIRFSIDPQSDPEALFRISPETGLITTAMELDREREHWHNITVIASQRGQRPHRCVIRACLKTTCYFLIPPSVPPKNSNVPLRKDNPSQVSRVVVGIETLDLNDNAPELDRQYSTALCDSSNAGQVVQVLRAIDRDEGGNDSTVYFSIPPESGVALNFSVRDSASLVLLSQLQPLSRSPSSTLTLYVPLVLRDGTSGLTSTGTVTVSVCPCLRGGAQAVCLPQQSMLPSPGLSTAALLAILACVATLLAVSALSLSLRRQKRDSLSPLEEDDVRENIITYDDEGGGEADTAAFDIAALQSAAPAPATRGPQGPGGPSLALRVGEFLRLRLAQVTFDPSQPPYDSVQVYGLEGTGSRAGSLSSLESDGEKEDWGVGLEDWGPQFQKLAQLFKNREKPPYVVSPYAP
uniref:Cadherin 24, type 2b n=1 Tax=Xiphophorus couchianus TaxID=32473 RepID=A0A3B5LRB6_9TELE